MTFASLVGVPIEITISVAGLKICLITAEIKKHKSIIKKKKKKRDKTVSLAKSKLNRIEILICRALIDSYISRDECVSVNNVIREYDGMEKNLKALTVHNIFIHNLFNLFIKYYYPTDSSIERNTESKIQKVV